MPFLMNVISLCTNVKTYNMQKYMLYFVLLNLLVSCRSFYFDDSDRLASNVHNPTIKMSTAEVTICDWICYLVNTTQDTINKKIYLIDYLDQINEKLPHFYDDYLGSYALHAFLRKESNMVSKRIYDPCKRDYHHIYVPKAAWDSIRKFHLYYLPITGVSYEQSLAYLQYRQDVYNECLNMHNGLKETKNRYVYECFLPSPAQFDAVQTYGDSLNTLGCNSFNFVNSKCEDCPNGKLFKKNPVLNKTGVFPTYAHVYYSCESGMFNFKGNAAEMTSVKGIAKGGSCQHPAAEAFNFHSQYYDLPESWLGFRVWYKLYPKIAIQ